MRNIKSKKIGRDVISLEIDALKKLKASILKIMTPFFFLFNVCEMRLIDLQSQHIVQKDQRYLYIQFLMNSKELVQNVKNN